MARLLLLFSLLTFLGCTSSEKIAVITGRLESNDMPTLWITKPVNDIHSYEFINKMEIDSNGNFKETVKVDEIAYVNIRSKTLHGDATPYAELFVQPGKSYYIHIVENDEQPQFTVNGKNVYQDIMELERKNDLFSLIYSDTPFDTVQKKAIAYNIREANYFQKLSDEGDITQAELEILLESSKQKLASNLILKGVQQIQKLIHDRIEDDKDLNYYRTFVNEQISQFDFSKPHIARSKFFVYLTRNTRNFYLTNNSDYLQDNFEKLRGEGKLRQFLYQSYDSLYLGKNKEAILTNEILEIEFFTTPKNFQEPLKIMKSFKAEYPESDYNIYLNTFYNDLITKEQNVAQSLSDDIYFMNSNVEKAFSEIWDEMKGNKWYVDIWATWCGPCIKEFQLIDNIDPILKQYGYKKMYISTDKLKDKDKWLHAIKYYDLKGTHVLYDTEKWNILKSMIDGRELNTIPRYLLVDEEGQIVNDDAARPSAHKKLATQIKELED